MEQIIFDEHGKMLCMDTSEEEVIEEEPFHDIDKISKSFGNTPLVKLNKLRRPHKYSCQIYGKCEYRNPSGSIWDRFVAHKIIEADKRGKFHRGTHLVTGGYFDLCKSLAWVGAIGNFPVTLLPESSSNDSHFLTLNGLGASVILSFDQDPLKTRTISCLKNHIKQLQDISGIQHYSVLSSSESICEESENCFESLAKELVSQLCNWPTDEVHPDILDFDVVACTASDKRLIHWIFKSIGDKSIKTPIFVGAKTTFQHSFDDEEDDFGNFEIDIKWKSISEAEAYDMTRRLVREEGLLVGPSSGAAMSAAMKVIEEHGLRNSKTSKILVIMTDSISASSPEFLSTGWMVRKGFYDPATLESLYWWYDMAIENVSPPVTLIVFAGTPVKIVWKAMASSSKTERAVVISRDKIAVGIVSYESLIALMNSAQEDVPVEDVCYKQFGVIDSKASFPELETLLQKYYWVINMHHLNYYDDNTKPDPHVSEEIIGAVNLADFMKYKKKVEAHHLTEFGISMSDGIPSDIWLTKFNKF